MHEAQKDFEYVPTNVTTAMEKQQLEGARRTWASRDSPVAVLRLRGEHNDMPHTVAMSEITRAAACHEATMQTLYRRLKTIDSHMKLYAVEHKERDHFWTEDQGGRGQW